MIIGGGVGGLTLALSLHQAGIACRVFEAAPDIRPLGVGINLLPHGMRELTELGLQAWRASRSRPGNCASTTASASSSSASRAGGTPATTGRSFRSIAPTCTKYCSNCGTPSA